MVARVIAGGLLLAVGWPAVLMSVALLQERLAQRKAGRWPRSRCSSSCCMSGTGRRRSGTRWPTRTCRAPPRP